MYQLASTSVMVMGTAPRAGKTILSLGLCRSLANHGMRVAPFKAICVIQPGYVKNNDHPFYAYGIIHHARAARVPFTTLMNPIAIYTTDFLAGELYIHGEPVQRVQLLNEDTLCTGSLSDEVRALLAKTIANSLCELRSNYDFLVIEGASSPSELSPAEDFPNIYVNTLTRASILLSASFSRGGSAAAIIGTGLTLPEHIRSLVRGFVLTDVRDGQSTLHARQLIERHLQLPFSGAIAHLPLWDGASYTDEEAYQIIAQAVESGLNHELLQDIVTRKSIASAC